MSSAAMALKGVGVDYNPSSLNTWLKGHGGYVSEDLFVWASINALGVTFLGKTSKSQIKSNLDGNNIVILNVHNGGHWVLATGIDGTNVFVNDPGYSTTVYTFDQIVEGQVGLYRVGNGYISMMIGELESMFNVGRKNRLIEADKGEKMKD
jgi:predicted double-glycine peptidase